jgi:hypothetical protein
VERELRRILIGRRDRILDRWLTKLSPLTWPEVRLTEAGSEVCLQDLATWSGVRAASDRLYATTAYVGDALAPHPVADAVPRDDSWVCVPLPEIAGPDYVIVDVRATSPDDDTGPARLHFYARGGAYRLVGLERPEDSEPPAP